MSLPPALPSLPGAAPTAAVASSTEAPHRVAIIDLGTNTFHLLVIDVLDRERHQVREKYKLPVQLGQGGIAKGVIAPEAYRRGMEALLRFRDIIDARNVTDVYAFGTSAIRNAKNGPQFVHEAQEKTGLDVRIIHGNEEAALIYLGVRQGVTFPDEGNVLLVDIGGGSVEFIVADAVMPKLLRSVDIGAARLLAEVRPDDPIKPKQIEATEAYIRKKMGTLLNELRPFTLGSLVGSSGSFETLGALVAARDQPELLSGGGTLNNYSFNQKQFARVHQVLLHTDHKARLALEGMDEMRADMIVLSSILVNLLVRELGLERITVSTFAMKEGILARYISQRVFNVQTDTQRLQREEAVRALGRKFQVPLSSTDHVAHLALALFDCLQAPFALRAQERELLHYAALLHPIGQFVGHSGHHKHGQYILNNSGLRGFSSNELLLMSNLVRYQRKSFPNAEHVHFNVLTPAQKDSVRHLSGILRLAVALDRAHRGVVRDLQAKLVRQRLTVKLVALEDPHIELEAAREERKLLEQAFGLDVVLEVASPQ